uniref:Uncharacterized protein n=1 Tax=Trypanosoma congolense (strain IL3000) TaxID=1068625 RepID=G0UR23_TRYCI|nr:conserved hypothetical protein [Trypanosoma congolense IL3000]
MSDVSDSIFGLPYVGRALSTAERAALQSSLPLLALKYNTQVHFWGKVTGVKGDYFVAQGMPDGLFGVRHSFLSVDGGTSWRPLPVPTEDQAAFCDNLRGVYIGDPFFLYKVRRDIPPEPEPEVTIPELSETLSAAKEKYGTPGEEEEEPEEEDDEEVVDEAEEGEDDEEEVVEPPKKRRAKFMIVAVPESVRLAHFISLHDKACSLIVRGQYVFTPSGCVEKNTLFAGQPTRHAMKPSCYLRVFHAGDPERNRVLYGPTYSSVTDCLSPITDDEPQGRLGCQV